MQTEKPMEDKQMSQDMEKPKPMTVAEQETARAARLAAERRKPFKF